MNEETIRLLETRRSIRDFERRAVDKEVTDELKRLTLRAPSAGNMELYTIIEVADGEKKKALAEICDNQNMIAAAPIVWLFLADMHKWETFFRLSGSDVKSGIEMSPALLGDLFLSIQDAMAAAENSVVAAEALGLGSCYVGDILENCERLRELFSLPPHTFPACLLIYGYPKSKKRYPSTPRPDISSSIFMTDSYAGNDFESLSGQYRGHTEYFREHSRLQFAEDTAAHEYYRRKYTSSFMKEMNRSAACHVREWLRASGVEL